MQVLLPGCCSFKDSGVHHAAGDAPGAAMQALHHAAGGAVAGCALQHSILSGLLVRAPEGCMGFAHFQHRPSDASGTS
jgi:hypothetical protein